LKRNEYMAIDFTISTQIAASPQRLYAAWLDSAEHSAMTGGEARVNGLVGEEFEAWDGYIHGKNLALEPDRRIVQSWRSSEFTEDEPDSLLEVTFEAVPGGETRITLHHSNLPANGAQYEQGWVESYFEPMKEYFEG
jgi:uncharacterized protein YndB with AHSA1/START domain